MLFRDCFTVSTPVHMGNAQPKWNGASGAVVLNLNKAKSSPRLFHSMTVSQYDHVVPHTDLGGRGYLGFYRRSCFFKVCGFPRHSEGQASPQGVQNQVQAAVRGVPCAATHWRHRWGGPNQVQQSLDPWLARRIQSFAQAPKQTVCRVRSRAEGKDSSVPEEYHQGAHLLPEETRCWRCGNHQWRPDAPSSEWVKQPEDSKFEWLCRVCEGELHACPWACHCIHAGVLQERPDDPASVRL